jgi:hypothetical protein
MNKNGGAVTGSLIKTPDRTSERPPRGGLSDSGASETRPILKSQILLIRRSLTIACGARHQNYRACRRDDRFLDVVA